MKGDINELLSNYKLKNSYFHSYHGDDHIFSKISVSEGIKRRIARLIILGVQERQKLPFELSIELLLNRE
jgi:hypothetical protein